MIYYTSWLSNDAQLTTVQLQQNEANAARYHKNLGPVRYAVSRLTAMLRRGWQLWRSHARTRAAISELSSLDDRILKDIGVVRGQIPGLAKQAGDATLLQVSKIPSAIPTGPEAATKAVTRPECQVIPLVPPERKRDTQFDERGPKQRTHLPLNAA